MMVWEAEGVAAAPISIGVLKGVRAAVQTRV